MLEVQVNGSVGESSPADPDSLEHTVAGQLVHDESRVQEAGGLVVVGHNAADEVGVGGVQGGQQGLQLSAEGRGHSLEGLGSSILTLLTLFLLDLLLGLSRVVSEEVDNQSVVGLLQLVHNSVIDRILVLVQPVGQVVVDNTGVMSNSKVSIVVLGAGLLLEEHRGLAQQVF